MQACQCRVSSTEFIIEYYTQNVRVDFIISEVHPLSKCSSYNIFGHFFNLANGAFYNWLLIIITGNNCKMLSNVDSEDILNTLDTEAEFNFRWRDFRFQRLFPKFELVVVRKNIQSPKTHSNIPMNRQLPYGDWTLKALAGCLPYAVGKPYNTYTWLILEK